jgi:hypothetical protein
MLQFPRAQCRSCQAPLSYFAGSCPQCGGPNQPNPVTVGVGLVALLLLCAATFLAVQLVRHPQPLEAASQRPGEPGATAPTQEKPDAYSWIVQAMAECDAQAKQKLDKLHFLIVPLARASVSLPGWSPQPISDVGQSGKLLSSGDALIGLRNGALNIYQKPITFVISDPSSGTLYKWKPTVGVAALSTSQPAAENLKLGFELPDVTDGIEWGPTVKIEKATCYRINPLVLARSRNS